jgi:hypothetical protein
VGIPRPDLVPAAEKTEVKLQHQADLKPETQRKQHKKRRNLMGDSGKKDKGGREDKKKPKLNPKEKKKLKQEKKKNK